MSNSPLTRIYNNLYNLFFKKVNRIKIDKTEPIKLVIENVKSLKHSNSLQTMWLLNLKRMYNLTRKNINLSNYHFLDVGCGNGIPLIYAYKKTVFKSYSGFDFIIDYVDISKKNISNSLNNKDIFVFHADASDYILDEKSYFILIFNSFDAFVMNKFLKNNYKCLVKFKSIIAYANCTELNTIKNFAKKIQKITKYKLAICFF